LPGRGWIGIIRRRDDRNREQAGKMLYAIFCYDQEAVTEGMSKEEDDALMSRLAAAQERLAKAGKLGPVARLMPTTAAVTLRKSSEPLVVDGPFAETKEQLLGFYVIDCDSEEEAQRFVRDLAGAATHGTGTYEIRPVRMFRPGNLEV
jgi:hypothetical protein